MSVIIGAQKDAHRDDVLHCPSARQIHDESLDHGLDNYELGEAALDVGVYHHDALVRTIFDISATRWTYARYYPAPYRPPSLHTSHPCSQHGTCITQEPIPEARNPNHRTIISPNPCLPGLLRNSGRWPTPDGRDHPSGRESVRFLSELCPGNSGSTYYRTRCIPPSRLSIFPLRRHIPHT